MKSSKIFYSKFFSTELMDFSYTSIYIYIYILNREKKRIFFWGSYIFIYLSICQ